MEAAPSYAELHCLSCFTFQRGASHAEELVARASALGYAALAITDECSMAGVVRAHVAARDAGLKLIVGTEIRLRDGPKLVLLAPDHGAYSELCALITRGRRATRKGGYRLHRVDVEELAARALVLWIPEDETHADWIGSTFGGRAWIAAELHRGGDEPRRIERLLALSQSSGLRIVAAGDVHMHVRARRQLQDLMTAIRVGKPVAECGEVLFPNGERHLRTLPALQSLYPSGWIAESLNIANRCGFALDQLHYRYPHEVVGAGHTAISWLRHLCEQGMSNRWPEGVSARNRQGIEDELALIAERQCEHFFLTVEDVVRWARGRGILCQGRGSAANSLVCFVLGITEVDPDRSRMLFARFMSRERKEPPDIDVDFEHQRREEVIQYIYEKYGRDRAAIAATVIHYRPRMAVRDVGRALGQSPDLIDRMAKSLAWWDTPEQLSDRLRVLGIDAEAPRVRLWIDLVRQLIGMPRHLSQHVGGFVISETPLHGLVPVENAAMPDRTIIQWDKDDLEALGLLKVDVLALGMLSAIRRSLEMISAWSGAPLALKDIPEGDEATYAMIQRAETVGVFQIESRAQMSMLPRLKPKNYYDLVIQVSIVRPGPIQGGMVHPYLRRREGKEAPRYERPELEAVLSRTLGVPLFQEQVIEIAMVAGNFTPGEADQVRRSMAAWKHKGGLEPIRDRLYAGMAQNGYTPDFARRIFEMILGFGDYGFPESHAASFALLAYASSWLKCHHPAAFFAGLLNSQPMGFYAPAQLVREARRVGVEVRPVDVSASLWESGLEPATGGAPALRLGLALVKGFNEAAARRIELARTSRAFSDVDDLCHRAALNARERRALADADALRPIAGHRHAARWAALGVQRLPGLLAGHAAREAPLASRVPREGEDIVADYEATGLTLRRHPVALLRPRMDRLRLRRAEELPQLPDGVAVRVGGLVINRQRPQTAKGTMFMTLEDETGFHNLVIRVQLLDEQREAVLGGRLLLARGRLQNVSGVIHIVVERFRDVSEWLGALPTHSRDFQ